MKKTIVLFIVFFRLILAQVTYYDGISVLSPTFISDLQNLVKSNYVVISYDNYASTILQNYERKDTLNGQSYVECVYSGYKYIYSGVFSWGVMSREHSWCVSWMPTSSGAQYSDQHNLFPTHQNNANARRSNYPLGEVKQVTYQFLDGKLGLDANGNIVYEPRDKHKGDAARALFYMAIRYDGVGGRWFLPSFQSEETLKKWHKQDPPDDWEKGRNEYIYLYTHKNRNPFIDHPEYADYINFSNLTYIPPSLQLAEEPTNYPSNFSIQKINSDTIVFVWNLALPGSQPPSGYLLIVRNYTQNFKPNDGAIFNEDIDISDGNGSLNLNSQTTTAFFVGLDTNKSYDFYIFSFNGDSLQRNYKTDGIVPSVKYIGKSQLQTLFVENFEGQSHQFISVSRTSNKNWTIGSTGGGAEGTSKYIFINGYGADEPSDDWLISPAFDLSSKINIMLEFYSWYRYTGPDLQLKVSTNYQGGDPSQAVWQTINFTKPLSQQVWTKSSIDLSPYAGATNFRFAFHYISTGSAAGQAALWQVDEVILKAESGSISIEKPSVPSANFTLLSVKNTEVIFKWTKGNGSSRLVIFREEIPIDFIPEDGVFYPGDLRYGYGSKLGDSLYSVYNGQGDSLKVVNLAPGKRYFLAIYEYNGIDQQIKYLTTSFLNAEIITTNNPDPILIVKWDFEDSDLISDIGNYYNQNKILFKSSNLTDPSTGAFPTGNPGKAYSQANWSQGQFIAIPINTKGITNLKIEFDARSSSTGPKNFILAYSLNTNATNLTEINGSTFQSPTAFSANPMFSFNLPSECENREELTIAFLCKENPTSADGTFRIDNIAVYGQIITSSREIFESQKNLYLWQNYPNPFNASTTISFYLPEDGIANIEVYDALGRKIIETGYMYYKAGINNHLIDLSELTSGVYYYSLKYKDRVIYKKMLLAK